MHKIKKYKYSKQYSAKRSSAMKFKNNLKSSKKSNKPRLKKKKQSTSRKKVKRRKKNKKSGKSESGRPMNRLRQMKMPRRSKPAPKERGWHSTEETDS